MNLTARINQHHISILQRLGRFHAMGVGTVGAKENNLEKGAFGRPDFLMGGIEKGADLLRGDAFTEHRGGGFMYGQGHIFRPLHKGKLGLGFNHAAGGRYARAIDILKFRGGEGDTIAHEKRRGFVEAHRAR